MSIRYSCDVCDLVGPRINMVELLGGSKHICMSCLYKVCDRRDLERLAVEGIGREVKFEGEQEGSPGVNVAGEGKLIESGNDGRLWAKVRSGDGWIMVYPTKLELLDSLYDKCKRGIGRKVKYRGTMISVKADEHGKETTGEGLMEEWGKLEEGGLWIAVWVGTGRISVKLQDMKIRGE